MNRFLQFFTAFALCLLGSACQSNSQNNSTTSAVATPVEQIADDFPYQLTQPDQTYLLPNELEEVSAISRTPAGLLAMVQDEKGTLFLFDESKKEVVAARPFTGNGDFEGLSIIGEQAYALTSDGTLFHMEEYESEHPKSTVIRTFLSAEDDTEGMTFDSTSQSLLIACKEAPVLGGKRRKDKRAIYRFDLETRQLDQQVYWLLDMHAVKQIFQAQARTDKAREKAAEFDPTKKGSFKPADLAVHPLTGLVYMVAANGQMLIVFDRETTIKYVYHLPKKIFAQPEGICFHPNGDMYISNEGKDDPANILRFRYQP